MKPLSPKQEKFVRAYVKDWNATRAYIDAGYSKKGANRAAHKLLRKAEVAGEIETRRAALTVTADKNLVAGVHEIEARLTAQMRGGIYEEALARVRGEIEKKRAAVFALESSLAKMKDEDRGAMVRVKILDAQDGIVRDELEFERLRLAQQAESNRAGVTLLKAKGAFEPRRTGVDNPTALLGLLVQNIIRSGIDPKTLMDQVMSGAIDATFSVTPGGTGAGAGSAGAGPKDGAGPGLFMRGLPEREGS